VRTRLKIALASCAYKGIKTGRKIIGLPDDCRVRRNGLTYALDLSQGIDFSIFLLGSFEPWTARILRKLITPGMVVLDIGANIGAHTLIIAQHVGPTGRVLAFEPTNFAIEKLRVNLSLNPEITGRVQIFQYFLTSMSSDRLPKQIYSSWPLMRDPDHQSHPAHLGVEMSTSRATPLALDDVLARENVAKIGLVKLDVDGFEFDVLDGAKTMMQRDLPIFVMELAPYAIEERGPTFEQFIEFFRSLNYHFYDERSGRQLPDDASGLRRLIGEGGSKNIVAHV
jgi:FkbM family methyltransferase